MSDETINGMVETINELERELEKYKWIPCSERLPEKGEYIVTWGDIGDGVVDIAYYGKPTNPTREVNGLCFYDYNDEYGDIPYSTVTAWMPLPQPYEETDHE